MNVVVCVVMSLRVCFWALKFVHVCVCVCVCMCVFVCLCVARALSGTRHYGKWVLQFLRCGMFVCCVNLIVGV